MKSAHRHVIFTNFFILLLTVTGAAQSDPTREITSIDAKSTVFILPFKGEVEIGLVHVLTKGFEQAKDKKAKAILLEMDTPGGRVDAALDIVDLILDSPIPVMVFVKGDASSAGAIISLAASQIYMEEMSTIGTASPVLIGSGGESTTMESKALSFVLAKVRTICERKKFDEKKTNLALAMVDKETELRDPEHPEQILKRKGIPLTLTAKEAKRVGFITAVVKDREDMLLKAGMSDAQSYFRQELVSEQIARFLSSTAVSSLLLTLGFLGIFIEFRSPGTMLPGILGALAIALFFWGHAIAHLGSWEGPLLFIIGAVLLGLEILVIPGFGFTGIAGICCIFASIVVTLMDRPITDPNFSWTFSWDSFSHSVFIASMTMMAGFGLAMASPLLFPILVKTPWGSWLRLDESEKKTDGYHSASDEFTDFLGKKGISRSVLRPAGIAEFEGRRIDVVSEGGFIQPQTPVEIIKIEGQRIVVRKV